MPPPIGPSAQASGRRPNASRRRRSPSNSSRRYSTEALRLQHLSRGSAYKDLIVRWIVVMILINQNRVMTPNPPANAVTTPSLPEVYRSIEIPKAGHWLKKFLAFLGPGYLVSVGYMDPGNWATDIAGGSKFGYTLLSVVLISNLMAILLQALCVRLGVATGRDLAQACRDYYSKPMSITLWLLC